METANLIYHFSVVCVSLIIFFLKITAPNAIFEFFARAICKIVPLYCILYAGIKIFQHFGILN